MTPPHRRLSGEWPPPFPRDHPQSLDWRTTRLEESHDQLNDRVDHIERRPHLPDFSSLPWLQIVGLLLLIALGVTGRISPETVEMMSKLLPGR